MAKTYKALAAGDSRGKVFIASAGISLATFFSLYSTGLVPYYVDGTEPGVRRAQQQELFAIAHAQASQAFPLPQGSGTSFSNMPQHGNTVEQIPAAQPERIIIRSVGMDVPVLNPESTSISMLDNALLSGTVRYPTSALLGQKGNVFIFGHTSHLPVVRNQMYKAFNELPNVKVGNTISLHGGGREYIYRVTSVRHVDAGEELVDLSPTQGRKLTLSTCDTFGAKSARWVVDAEFVGSYPSGSANSASL
jgi:LPXTG-site transpeptidase (sortase) family protein